MTPIRRIARGLVFHDIRTRDVRPVRIFNPSFHEGFIAQMVKTFQHPTTHHHPNGLGWTALWGIKGTKGVFKKRPVDRISQPLDLMFWMENGIEFRVESLGLFGDYFLDHFDKILSPKDAFPCRFQNPVFANRAPFNPPYKGNDELYLSF